MGLSGVWVLLLMCVQVPAPDAAAQASAELYAERTRVLAREREALHALAGRYRADGLSASLAQVERLLSGLPPAGPAQRFQPLLEWEPPRATGLSSREASDSLHDLAVARRNSVQELLKLAQRASDPAVGQFSLADACARDVLERDPDHPEARRMLGFLPHEGGWATPYAVELLRQGKVRHRVYGWVPGSWVEHLDRGELPGTSIVRDRPSQWLPAAEADRLRANMLERPWTITTHHFSIRTNVPLDEAIAFGDQLEALHALFFLVLGDVVPRDRNPVAQRFLSGRVGPASPGKRYEVWYFADKQEYVDYFQRQFERDESLSLGYYMPPAEAREYRVPARSYFYRDRKNAIDSTATLFHEASHQLLFETAGPSRYEKNAGHFWVWEGLGTYFETAQFQPDGSILYGGLVGPRVGEARRRIVGEGQMVPIAELTAMTRGQFQAGEAIYLHYSESMALALYLMNGENGALRPGFRDYIRAAYEGKLGRGRTLGEFVGIGEDELDRRLIAFLRETHEPAPSTEGHSRHAP